MIQQKKSNNLYGPVAVKYENAPTGRMRYQTPEVDDEKCIQCMMCTMNCPCDCLFLSNENKLQIRYDYCKGCGICANTCFQKAITLRQNEG